MTELSTTVPLHLGDVAVLGLLAVGLFLLGRLGWIVIDLAIDTMRRGAAPELLDEYSDDIPNHGYAAFDTAAIADAVELPGDREHYWPHKVIPPVNGYPDLDEDEHPAEPSGQHAPAPGRMSVDEVTGYARLHAVIPAPVDDTAALAVVAAVSSQDGQS